MFYIQYYDHRDNKTPLTHCLLNSLSNTIYWKGPISILGTCISSYKIYIFLEKNG